MIYAKTKLKKLPVSCHMCVFSDRYTGMQRRCQITGKAAQDWFRDEDGKLRHCRPNDCPLIEKEEQE